MAEAFTFRVRGARSGVAAGLLLLGQVVVLATDWPQYRGPATDGSSPDAIATTWATNSAHFVVWTNMSLTNGFSCFAVSQGRAFTLISKDDGNGNLLEYCVGVDAATGINLWATPIGDEPWSPAATGDGGAGSPPYWTGDGPRTTPAVKDGRVVALSSGRYYPAQLHLVCLNANDGSVIWSNDLVSAYGASTIPWDNAASPCLDDDLVFVNLHTSTNNQNLAAFRVGDGGLAWSSQNENVTHTTPVVATMEGVRQVIFATRTGLVSLNRANGSLLWKFSYPFFPIDTSMGASPIVCSNTVFCTASYGRGAAAAQIALSNGTWTVTQLYYKTGANYRSTWTTPVCYQGFVYMVGGDTAYLSAPLNCIELSTGDLKWSTGGIGMGGLILVNTNLLVLTEKGELVLVQPDPNAYVELARYTAFGFSLGAPGKCWNSPAFSNGRIYARSTRGGICLDVSVPGSSPLKLLTPHFLNTTQLELVVSTVNGSPIDSNRLASISILSAASLPTGTWSRLTNNLTLTNGVIKVSLEPSGPRRYYIATEQP